MANRRHYGLRVHKYRGGLESGITPYEYDVADAYTGAVNGVGNIDLYVGDLVRRLANGTVEHADGTEGGSGAETAIGVVVGIKQYFNGTYVVSGNFVPRASTGGGRDDRRTIVQVVHLNDADWAVETDDPTAYTTLATYNALRGSNLNLVMLGTGGKQDAKADVGTVNTTETLHFRILDIDRGPHISDYSAAGVSLILRANLTQLEAQAATPVTGI